MSDSSMIFPSNSNGSVCAPEPETSIETASNRLGKRMASRSCGFVCDLVNFVSNQIL
jgi:hypothetical protein